MNRLSIKVYNLFFLSFISLSIAACGSKDNVELNENDTLISVEDSVGEDYSVIPFDEHTPLAEREQKVFESKGEIDKNLTAKELETVEIYYKNYLKNSKITIERFMYRAKPYLAFVKKVFKDKNMPEELAYLAFIESGYNPWAVSRSNAVGMWQFMPKTGKHFGLVQDWWIDDRRDPYKATEAAATYLKHLYDDYFQDWFLAIAAYNAGPGKIQRALDATGTNNYFDLIVKNNELSQSLKVKDETIQYVPRFIAMTKIMRNFEGLGYYPEIHTFKGDRPIIKEQAIGILAEPGTDLASIAKDLNMSWRDFSSYNPAFRRYITPPDRSVKFYVPIDLEERAIAASKDTKNTGITMYKIVRGDTLTKISRKTGVPIKTLRQLNHKSEPLQIGATLRIPRSSNSSINQMAQADIDKSGYYYSIKGGDTLGVIADRHNIRLKDLMAANPSIKNVKTIQKGQKIYIPAKNTDSSNKNTYTAQNDNSSKKNTNSKSLPSYHTVKSGDTLFSISQHYNLSMTEIKNKNKDINANKLKLGQKIYLASSKTQTNKNQSYKSYSVKSGDTFTKIAKEHGMKLDDLIAANPDIKSKRNLSIGQKINIPASASRITQISVNTKPLDSLSSYIIKKGDTLYSISRSYGINQNQLLQANPQLKSNTKIKIGQKLNIPDKNSTYKTTKDYTVSKGDSYWSISKQFSMSVDELLALNNMEKTKTLSIGKKIKVYSN